jgi:hypothetical protein
MATQACGFITIVSGTFLLHTTKDLDLTGVDLGEMTRSTSLDDASGGSTSFTISASVRERRLAGQSIELGKPNSIEVMVADSGGDKLSNGSNVDEEQRALLGSGAVGAGANAASLATRKPQSQKLGVFGL